MLGELRLLVTLVLGAGFLGGRYLDFRGSLKLLSSPHLRGGDKGLLRRISIWVCLEWISSQLCQRRNRSLSFLWWS